MADIEKMILQIKLRRGDQNAHRFLWRKTEDEDLKAYCMTRVTFGDMCSPFLPISTVQNHAQHHHSEYPKAADEVSENMYVDDLLTGAEDAENAVQLKNDLRNLLNSGGFKLTKWASNSDKVMKSIPPQERAQQSVICDESEEDIEKMSNLLKVLGVSWDIKEDLLLFKANESISKEDESTKRGLSYF